MSRIFYLSAAYKRWTTTVPPFLNSYSLMAGPGDSLTLVDWAGEAKDNFVLPPGNITIVPASQDGPINRALARNFALKAVWPQDDDIIFFVDCDMLLPKDFSDRVRQHVAPGCAYFPVCYSLYRNAPAVVSGNGAPHHARANTTPANGWWRTAGRGNCGFLYLDFLATIGSWDSDRFGTNYGKEDDDVYWRATTRLQVVRENVPGFFHQWHPTSNELQNPSVRNVK